jgi:undecaprenyl-diphosphatase
LSRIQLNMATMQPYGVSTLVEYLDSLETQLCLRLNALSRNVALRQFFRSISKLGDYPAYLIVGIPCAALLEESGLSFMLQMLATAAVGMAIYKTMKNTLVRERPYVTHAGVSCAAAPLDRYSFPSGHTMHAVSFAILFSAYVPIMIWLMAPFAVLVAVSRVVLGLHYPSDVVVGAILGATLAVASLAVFA